MSSRGRGRFALSPAHRLPQAAHSRSARSPASRSRKGRSRRGSSSVPAEATQFSALPGYTRSALRGSSAPSSASPCCWKDAPGAGAALAQDGGARRHHISVAELFGDVKGACQRPLLFQVLARLPQLITGQVQGVPQPPFAAHTDAFLHLSRPERPAPGLQAQPFKFQAERLSGLLPQQPGPLLRRTHLGHLRDLDARQLLQVAG